MHRIDKITLTRKIDGLQVHGFEQMDEQTSRWNCVVRDHLGAETVSVGDDPYVELRQLVDAAIVESRARLGLDEPAAPRF